MEQINQYKEQYRELNFQRKNNDKDIRRLKGENDQMEKNIDQMRKQNEKLARAIRRVKDNPDLVDEVGAMGSLGEQEFLESQIESKELDRLRLEIKSEKQRRDKAHQQTDVYQIQLTDLNKEAETLQKLLVDYAQPLEDLEKLVKKAESDQIKA